MGIEGQALRLLLLGLELDVDLSRTLTIGRLDYYPDAAETRRIFAEFGRALSAAEAERLAQAEGCFSEPVIRALGAGSVDSLDISDFEGATVLHDLNQEPPPELAGRFSAVIDGGTLEHVFDFPRALAGCMKLVRPGGHLILMLPANNEMGHGFYQFSPELFFRALAPANGFRVEALFLASLFGDGAFVAVRDPAEVGRRVGWNANSRPTQCFVIARRLAETPIFATMPQQSDYQAEWAEQPVKRDSAARLVALGKGPDRPPLKARVLRAARRHVPARVQAVVEAANAALKRPPADAFLPIRPSPDAARALTRFYGR